MHEQQQHEFKMVKRSLSAIQKVIKMDLKDGQPPRERDVADFVSASMEMNRLGVNEWQKAMDQYMERLKQFEAAIAGGEIQTINDSFQGLLDCKISCHKAFR